MDQLNPVAVKNVVPYVIENPVRIDLAVNPLQSSFGNIEWLAKSFSRAVRQSRQRDNVDYVFPAVFSGPGFDPLDMLLLDNFPSYSFMFAHDPETSVDYEQGVRNTFNRRLSCIFWLNLQRIDNLLAGHDFSEHLKQDAIDAIEGTTFTPDNNNGSVLGIEIIQTFDEPQNIFREFSLNLTETHFLHYPYRGFRIELDCNYISNC